MVQPLAPQFKKLLKAIQNPEPSDPAATFPLKMLFGLLTQKVEGESNLFACNDAEVVSD